MTEPVELDRTARDVIAAGRDGVAPNEFVRERLRRSVDRTLRASSPPARSRSRTAPLLAAFGAAALGGALYANELAQNDEDRSVPPKPAPPILKAPPAVAPAPVPAPSPEPRAMAPAPPAPAGGTAPASGSGNAAPRLSRSQQLGAEIELLARVNAAVNAGDGKRALDLLGEYDRKFKPSILGEERAAASVLALCAAGRTTDARAAAERFAKSSPRSPLLGRIAKSCAGSR